VTFWFVVVIGFGADEDPAIVAEGVALGRGRGCLTVAFGPAGADWEFLPPAIERDIRQELVETLYHMLWELVHVFFEHRGLLRGRRERIVHDAGASSFLYPFLGQREEDLEPVLADVRSSVLAKSAEVSELRAQTLRDGEHELREAAREMIAKYDQPALVENYIGGREFTVGMLGERRPKILPLMEVVFLDQAETRPVYSFEFKQDSSAKIRYDVPARLEVSELKALERAARECFMALGCRDVARVDFRMNESGKIYFLECNPLPGLTPGWSDLVLIAKAAGMEYNALIADILSGAIRRYKERERERRTETRTPEAGKAPNGVNGTHSAPPLASPDESRVIAVPTSGT